jgi:hypothetical protein
MKNNLCMGCGAVIEIRPNSPTVVSSDFNAGFNVHTDSWTVYNSAIGYAGIPLATYISTYGQELRTSVNDPKIDALYQLQAGSAGIGVGANLTSLGITALNKDASGNERPAIGSWDAGALQFRGGELPPAPANLRVQ